MVFSEPLHQTLFDSGMVLLSTARSQLAADATAEAELYQGAMDVFSSLSTRTLSGAQYAQLSLLMAECHLALAYGEAASARGYADEYPEEVDPEVVAHAMAYLDFIGELLSSAETG